MLVTVDTRVNHAPAGTPNVALCAKDSLVGVDLVCHIRVLKAAGRLEGGQPLQQR